MEIGNKRRNTVIKFEFSDFRYTDRYNIRIPRKTRLNIRELEKTINQIEN